MKVLLAYLCTLSVIAVTLSGSVALAGSPISQAGAPAAVPQSGPQAPPQVTSQNNDQGKSLLMKIYMAAARIHDLLDVAQGANWKMTDAERSQFQQEVKSVEDQFQTLEKSRYQFYYHPDDAEAAGKTLESLRAVIPQIGQIAKDARQYGGNAAAPLEQSLSELSGLRDNLASYLTTQFPGKFPPQTETSAPPLPAAAPEQGQPGAVTSGQAQSAQAAQPPQPAEQNEQAKNAGQPQKSQPAQSATAVAPQAQPAVTSQAPAANPPAPAAASTPSTPPQTPATSASPVEAAAPQPEQVKALLRNVYLTDARVGDLLGLLQPDKWKMPDSERALFNERLQSVKNQLTTVEKWRYQFLYNIDKTDLGQNTVSALGDLVPGILGVETTVTQYEGQAAGSQFAQAARQLAASRNTLASYVAYVEAKAQKELAAPPSQVPPGQKGLETERVNVAPMAPPVSTLAVEPPPLTPGQVKSILYKVYISEFRIRDLLSQEHPDQWKGASPAERTMAAQARAALASNLDELEKWRALFSDHPGSMYDAFQTYRSVNALFHPLRVFGREAGKYENENMADDYARRETDMEAQLNGLIPYISFILQHQDRNLEMFQTDLAGCQTQLGYAMHSQVRASQPMKNIVPVFQGRRRSRKSKTDKKGDAEKKAKSEKR
ncbi:MAG TPA: hypothetical protein VGX94_08900 [Terriglobia bacterium]|nr:hypothetical protein [Terriglobia bacterium]